MEILAAIFSMILVFSLLPLYLWRRLQASRIHNSPRDIDRVPDINATGRQTGARRMRRRHVGSSSSSAVDSEETQDDGEEEDASGSGSHVSKAFKKKETKRQEKEARRQAEEGMREMRKMKQDRYDEMRRRKDEQREAEEHKKEEEARTRKAKEEEAANAEFEKWKDAFSVETEGTTVEDTEDGGQGLLSDFVEYIKKQKCVPLEDLAAEFNLRTQECINRILALEKMGRLSGVMDERGKYIYISLEEMKAVAEYIKRQGRVSISHLASKSNEFIKLQSSISIESH